MHAQSEVNVKGTVTQQNGEPIVAASVVVKGTKKGTVTLTDGSFQVQAASNATIVITHTGFVGQEIKLNGDNYSNISIRLIETKNSLDEVVVVGYGTRKNPM